MKTRNANNLSHLASIYSATAGNRTVPLFKTLLSSNCQNDCKFCINRHSRQCSRYSLEPEEMARYALHLYEKGLIQGVFLSSALERDPNYVSKREVETARILREAGFHDYVHLRLMPGTSLDIIKQAANLADRIGINIETANKQTYNELKTSDVFDYKTGIWKRMKWMSREYKERSNTAPYGNLSAGIDTQFIIGATSDTDKAFLKQTQKLYTKFDLARTYYSAFEPVSQTPLSDRAPCPKDREYRLYKTSFLLKEYDFDYTDLIYDEEHNLIKKDPKKAFAEAHNEIFPVHINSASYDRLLLVPGIGSSTAQNILDKRPVTSFLELKSCGPRIQDSLEFIDFPHTTLHQFIK